MVPADTVAAAPDPGSRRRFATGSAVGALPALAAFAWLLTGGRADLLAKPTFGNFYDAQARALLHGHWDVPARELFIEGFHIGDKTYTYFGIWPSVLRMPVLAVGDSLYGRLTQASMLLAFAVALVAVAALDWRIRGLVRPARPCTRGEAALAGVVVFAIGCGTTTFFLAGRAWVYHEAILWGIAWALIAFERLVAFGERPSATRLAAASASASLAFLSRPSVGLGPVLAIALVLAGLLLRRVRHRLRGRGARALDRLDWLAAGIDGGRATRWTGPVAVALALPCVLYAWMNWSRFGTVFSVPWSKQFLVSIDERHRAALEANGGTYFGLKFLPSTVVQYLRPDALGASGIFPWVTFPRFTPPVFGNAVFDTTDLTSSVPASMPALLVLGILGVYAVVATRRVGAPGLARLRVPLLGAGGGVVFVLAISFIAQRYLGDWVPLLVIAALAGLHVLLARRETAGRRGRRAAGLALGAVAVLAVWGVWVNLSLGVLYQRLYNPELPSQRAGMIAFQYDVDGWLGGGQADLERASALPRRAARAGTTLVVGDCASVYWSDGHRWWPVEGAPAAGWFRFRGYVPEARGWQPLVSWGPNGAEQVVGIRRLGSDVQLGWGVPGDDGTLRFLVSARRPVGEDPPELDVQVDRALGEIRAELGGDLLLNVEHQHDLEPGPFVVGRATTPGVAEEFTGQLEELPARRAVCDAVSSASATPAPRAGSSS
ncbi:MAG: hypothetical protein FJW88_06045 [Actinobacteria bacterium]|nr:hypothetical protein [Actinomycetota bacterium]